MICLLEVARGWRNATGAFCRRREHLPHPRDTGESLHHGLIYMMSCRIIMPASSQENLANLADVPPYGTHIGVHHFSIT
jgi:hypothetical protein